MRQQRRSQREGPPTPAGHQPTPWRTLINNQGAARPNPITKRYNIPPQQFWLHGPRSGPSVEFDAAAGIWNLYSYPEVQLALTIQRSSPRTPCV